MSNITIQLSDELVQQAKAVGVFNEAALAELRPTLSLLMHDDLQVDELNLLHDLYHNNLVGSISKDSEKLPQHASHWA